MIDEEKPKDTIEGHNFDTNDDSKKSGSSSKAGLKDKIVGKIASTTLGKSEETNIFLPEAVMISDNIRTILMGLFLLLGFIVLVFAIFTASVSVELAQTATGVFMVALIAAIVGAFALFGVVIYQIHGENKIRQL